MSNRYALKALKRAKQSRSRQTYQAILDATAHILITKPTQLNTNTIANIAGVSIGSVYQYFPNKYAILGELIEREFSLDLNLLKLMAQKYTGRSLKIIIINFLDTILLIVRREFKLKQALNNKLYETDRIQQANKLQVNFINLLSTLFSSASDWPTQKNAKLIATICFTISAHCYWSINESGEFTDIQLKEELINMFAYYFNQA